MTCDKTVRRQERDETQETFMTLTGPSGVSDVHSRKTVHCLWAPGHWTRCTIMSTCTRYRIACNMLHSTSLCMHKQIILGYIQHGIVANIPRQHLFWSDHLVAFVFLVALISWQPGILVILPSVGLMSYVSETLTTSNLALVKSTLSCSILWVS